MRQELVSVGISDKTVQDQIINEIRKRKFPESGKFKQNTAVESQEHMKQIPITVALNPNAKLPLMPNRLMDNVYVPRLDGVLATNEQTVKQNYKIKEVPLFKGSRAKIVEVAFKLW